MTFDPISQVRKLTNSHGILSESPRYALAAIDGGLFYQSHLDILWQPLVAGCSIRVT